MIKGKQNVSQIKNCIPVQNLSSYNTDVIDYSLNKILITIHISQHFGESVNTQNFV